MAFLSVENLTLQQERRRRWFRYDLKETVFVDDISFEVEKGGSLGIVGEEKSGKNALVMALLKMQSVASGKITFAEVETTALGDRHFRRLRKQIQAVFSDRFGQLSSTLTVDQMLTEVADVWFRDDDTEARQERLERVMVECELAEATRVLFPEELDAVERQKVALCRALLVDPELLICHGFTHALDAVEQAELLNLVAKVREERRLTLLVVTHDLAVAHHLSDVIAVIHRGKLVETAPAEQLVSRPEHDYTKRLVSCSI